jgi:2,3-bisphosphoglycerate-dependent phosphoglycerate mutase
MRLYFIRHGQSVNNALWDETGASSGRDEDPELTEIGHKQAGLLADFIAKKDTEARADGKNGEPKRDSFRFTHLYTSLMVRSVATASHLSRALNLPLLAWPEIHECGGIYLDGEEGEQIGLPGKSPAYFAQHYSHLILPDTVKEPGWWNRPFEADEARPLRAQQVLETLLERHGKPEDRVAIVSHGAFYMELMRVMFKIGEPRCWYMMYNTAISRFDFHEDGEITLSYHNRTDHLPEGLIT